MDFYTNAQETEKSAIDLFSAGQYRHSVFLACLAVELYLKSRLRLVPHRVELEKSHDVIGLYDALLNRFRPKLDMWPMVNLCRKYFNESRYPYSGNTDVYTQAFASDFVGFIADIRDFIDNVCVASAEDLENMYPRNKG